MKPDIITKRPKNKQKTPSKTATSMAAKMTYLDMTERRVRKVPMHHGRSRPFGVQLKECIMVT